MLARLQCAHATLLFANKDFIHGTLLQFFVAIFAHRKLLSALRARQQVVYKCNMFQWPLRQPHAVLRCQVSVSGETKVPHRHTPHARDFLGVLLHSNACAKNLVSFLPGRS